MVEVVEGKMCVTFPALKNHRDVREKELVLLVGLCLLQGWGGPLLLALVLVVVLMLVYGCCVLGFDKSFWSCGP